MNFNEKKKCVSEYELIFIIYIYNVIKTFLTNFPLTGVNSLLDFVYCSNNPYSSTTQHPQPVLRIIFKR